MLKCGHLYTNQIISEVLSVKLMKIITCQAFWCTAQIVSDGHFKWTARLKDLPVEQC